MAYNPEDLDPIEVALLGVLSVGLPPSRAAGSDTFRVDHVTAVVAALQAGEPREANLAADATTISTAFAPLLRTAIESLVHKGLVARTTSGVPAAAGGYEPGLLIDMVHPDEQPAVLDRFLAQLCMEKLFNIPAVYPFLMERYSASGEVWRRLRDEGYGR